MTNTLVPAPVSDFSLNDAVRLVDRHGDIASGSVGRILGRFARSENPTFVVSFVRARLCVLEVRPDEIVLVDDVRAAA